MRTGSTAGRLLAAVGAAGSLLFALVHFYWAAGGRWGVPGGAGDIGDRPLFLAYDIAAGVAFVAFAVVGAVLAANSVGLKTRRVLVRVSAVGGALAVLRGGVGIVQVLTAAGPVDVGAGYDVVFAVGGVVYLLAAWLLRSASVLLAVRP